MRQTVGGTMCNKRTFLACFVIIWLGCCLADAQIASLRRTGDERERYFKAYRLVWSVTEVRTAHPPPENPQSVRQEAELLERELRARGVRTNVEAVRKQLEKQYTQMRHPNVLVSRGDWEVEWGRDVQGGEFLFISGVRQFHDEKVRFEEFYGDGWGVQVGIPASGRPGLPPLVWCCTGHCTRYPALNDGGLDIGTDELSVIACLNALRISGETGWEVVGRTKDSVYVRKRDYLDTYGVFEMDVVLDLKHGGIPIRIMKRNSGYEGQIEVTRCTRLAGYWLPESVRSIFRTRRQSPGMTRERMWHLRGVQPKRGASLEGISTLQTVQYWGMRDLRAYGCNLTLGEMLTGDKDVFYPWKGQLPTISEVKAMLAARQRGYSRGASSATWWRIIPPLLLITIGILWYWRLRRGEGHKA